MASAFLSWMMMVCVSRARAVSVMAAASAAAALWAVATVARPSATAWACRALASL
jgi:hypothetical protein